MFAVSSVLFGIIVLHHGYAFEFSFEYASKCKVFYVRDGYAYKTFFKLQDMDNHNVNNTSYSDAPRNTSSYYEAAMHGNGTLLVDMHMAVLTPRDAHILLSSTSNPSLDDAVYEIVLGAGGNSFSEIRVRQRSHPRHSRRSPMLLSSIKYTVFWLSVSSDGYVTIGKEGDLLPLLSYKDPEPIAVNYFSFASWSGVEAQWLYDCPAPGEQSDTNSTEVPVQQTDLERLRSALFGDYDPYKQRTDIKEIRASLQLNQVTLDTRKGVIESRGVLQMVWIDEALQWDSAEYGNITHLRSLHREVWEPQIQLLNAAYQNKDDVLGSNPILVTSEGIVTWLPPAHLKAWCDMEEGLKAWPRDTHACQLILSVYDPQGSVEIVNGKSVDNVALIDNIGSEWTVISFKVTEDIYNVTIGDVEPTKAIFININLKRKNEAFGYLIFAPFIVSIVFCMLSLWIKDTARTGLICIGLLITAVSLAAIGSLVPPQRTHVPWIVTLHSWGFVGVWIIMCNNAIGAWFIKLPPNAPPPSWTKAITNNAIVRYLLCLEDSKIGADGAYETLVQTSEAPWKQLAVFLDRICFIVTAVMFTAICSSGY